MPRSFLVKKCVSKKPNYGQLDSMKRAEGLALHSPQKLIPAPLSCSAMPRPVANSQLLGKRQSAPLITPAPLTAAELNSVAIPLKDTLLQRTHYPPTGARRDQASPFLEPHTTFRDSLPAIERLDLLESYPFQLPSNPKITPESGSVPSPFLSLVPDSQERFQCFDCHRAYFTLAGLAKHRQLCCEWECHKCFSCKYCDKEYVSLGALKMHIRTHTLPCVCKLCGKAFSRPWLLQGHIRTHTGEKPFSCPHCSRAFADRSNLRAHLQTHSDIKKYQCKVCSKTFSRVSLLSKHEEAGCCPQS